MSSVNSTFTAVGSSAIINVGPRNQLSWSVSGIFIGTMLLQKAVGGANAWSTVKTITSAQQGAIEEGGLYRFYCSAYTSGTIVYSVTEKKNPIVEWFGNNGDGMSIDQNGVKSPLFKHVGQGAGSVDGTPEVTDRFGRSDDEGLEIVALDQVITLVNAVKADMTTPIPAGAVIVSVQTNNENNIFGDGSGDNLLAKIGIGTAADPDAYGKTDNLRSNHKINTLPDWAVLGAETQLSVYAVKTSGDACTEKFVAGGKVRVRVHYFQPNGLDDSATASSSISGY